MNNYLELMRNVLETGTRKNDRTGTGTISIFGAQLRFPLNRFPLVTTKKIHLRSVIVELLWFLRGDTNIAYLHEHGVHIWDEWADQNGGLGPVYGAQWRSWRGHDGETVDQISRVVTEIKENPDSRRLMVVAYNPADVEMMALPPCHAMFQFYVSGGRLSCQLYQRSCDLFLGVPFNVASYALLTMMIAQQCNLKPGEFIWTGGDIHLYLNHLDQAREQLTRKPYPAPIMEINRRPDSIFGYDPSDFAILGYLHHPAIRAPISV